MSIQVLPVDDFLVQQKIRKAVLFDTRSEKEFEKAHIPGAVSLPLLSNEHRHIIGTIYKEHGREAAVLKGFELVGPLFHEKLQIAKKLAGDQEVFLYCWRGGMRSNIMAWLFQMIGLKVTLLEHGYKSYRNHVLQIFEEEYRFLILGGMTGSGKTEVLQDLEKLNEQMIDLEHLASHKGSAFGLLGMPEQPSQEHFENLLADALFEKNKNELLWLENESRNIGKVNLPQVFYNRMKAAPIIEMEVSVEERSKRILVEYGIFAKELLAENTRRIEKRLGGQHMKQALIHLEENDLEAWLKIILNYYDKTYTFSNERRESKQMLKVPFKWTDKEVCLRKILNAKKEIEKK